MGPRRYYTDPFTDLLFNALLGFTFLFLLTILFLNPVSKLGRINLKAEFIISVEWPEDRGDDVDLWVEDPNGEIVSYLRREAGWLHLDRDDRGDINDTIWVNGEPRVHPINQEVVTIRGVVAGEYVVNLYYYEAEPLAPVEAVVKVEKVNPTLQLVYAERVVLEAEDTERTVIRFSLAGDGTVLGTNTLPKRLTPYGLDPV